MYLSCEAASVLGNDCCPSSVIFLFNDFFVCYVHLYVWSSFAGVNMGYMENSYSNSNNGGSVNSQDSLWQMKMAAAASNNGSQTGIPSVDPQSQFQHSHPNLHTHGSTYGYDPMSHGGYGAVDDYAAYPQQPGDLDYGHHMNQGRNSANPSRQEYAPSGDPYAAVQKPRRRMDQHIGKFEECSFIVN